MKSVPKLSHKLARKIIKVEITMSLRTSYTAYFLIRHNFDLEIRRARPHQAIGSETRARIRPLLVAGLCIDQLFLMSQSLLLPLLYRMQGVRAFSNARAQDCARRSYRSWHARRPSARNFCWWLGGRPIGICVA